MRRQLITLKYQLKQRKKVIENLANLRYNYDKKTLIFKFLHNYMQERKLQKKLEIKALYIYIQKLKKKAFDLVKHNTIFKNIKLFEQEVSDRIHYDLEVYETSLKDEKDTLLDLIYKAEERLKHENRKKIQSKLLLDQVVLRGVSAMNMQALYLTQNSLKGIAKF